MNKAFQYLLSIVVLLIPALAGAQSPEMADAMRSDGKIYVVVGIILIVLIGLIVYLITLDRKISNVEKEIREHKSN